MKKKSGFDVTDSSVGIRASESDTDVMGTLGKKDEKMFEKFTS